MAITMNTTIDETPKKKSLWGYGVVIVYTMFALGTLAVVYFSFTQNVDLVTKDYYAKSLVHEQQIQSAKNGESQHVSASVSSDKSMLQVLFPVDKVTGTVYLYRPSGSQMDKEFAIQQDAANTMNIATNGLEKGFWRVKVQWKHDATDYYNEFKIEL